MEGVITRVHERLHSQLFDVEEQLKALADLISSVRGGKGGSAIVYGQQEDGRSAIVLRALEIHGQGVSTQHLWLSRFGTESNALQTLLDSESSKEPRIIVVDRADDLVCKSKQALLYRLLDRAKTGPWLVLLIITDQNMISSLEKRVRSRLPNARVFTGEALSEDRWGRLFEQLLTSERKEEKENIEEKPAAVKNKGRKGKKVKEEVVKKEEERAEKEGGKEEKVWAEFVRRCLADPEMQREKQRLYEYSGHLSVVKRAINLWLVLLEREDVEEAMNPSVDDISSSTAFRRTIDHFGRAVEAIVPVRDQLAIALNNVSYRTFCVLAAAARRMRCNPDGTFSYAKIAVDFMHQCNSVDRRMLPDSELQTFKELDRLCELGVVAAVGSTTHAHSFRQIALNYPLPLLMSNVRAGCHNAALKEWFESQPVN